MQVTIEVKAALGREAKITAFSEKGEMLCEILASQLLTETTNWSASIFANYGGVVRYDRGEAWVEMYQAAFSTENKSAFEIVQEIGARAADVREAFNQKYPRISQTFRLSIQDGPAKVQFEVNSDYV